MTGYLNLAYKKTREDVDYYYIKLMIKITFLIGMLFSSYMSEWILKNGWIIIPTLLTIMRRAHEEENENRHE